MKIPLVLVSGLASDESLWEHQAAHLSDVASIQIVCPKANTPEKMVEEVLKGAPPTFAMAGHSMGGWLCLELMRIAPERVSQLCLLNTSAREDTEEKRNRRLELIERAKTGQYGQVACELADRFVQQSPLKERVEKMFLTQGKEIFISQEKAMLDRQECQSVLASIACPTLVIHAAQDKNFGLQEHVEIVEEIYNSKLAIVEDSGHMSPIEMPQAITSLLRYWLIYF